MGVTKMVKDLFDHWQIVIILLWENSLVAGVNSIVQNMLLGAV